MKCNYKKSLQNKPVNVVEEYRKFVFEKATEMYYDKNEKTLKPIFFDEFFDFVIEINQNRAKAGIEQFITFEMTNEHTARWFDEAYSDECLELRTPNSFLTLYAYLQSFVFQAKLENGTISL